MRTATDHTGNHTLHHSSQEDNEPGHRDHHPASRFDFRPDARIHHLGQEWTQADLDNRHATFTLIDQLVTNHPDLAYQLSQLGSHPAHHPRQGWSPEDNQSFLEDWQEAIHPDQHSREQIHHVAAWYVRQITGDTPEQHPATTGEFLPPHLQHTLNNSPMTQQHGFTNQRVLDRYTAQMTRGLVDQDAQAFLHAANTYSILQEVLNHDLREHLRRDLQQEWTPGTSREEQEAERLRQGAAFITALHRADPSLTHALDAALNPQGDPRDLPWLHPGQEALRNIQSAALEASLDHEGHLDLAHHLAHPLLDSMEQLHRQAAHASRFRPGHSLRQPVSASYNEAAQAAAQDALDHAQDLLTQAAHHLAASSPQSLWEQLQDLLQTRQQLEDTILRGEHPTFHDPLHQEDYEAAMRRHAATLDWQLRQPATAGDMDPGTMELTPAEVRRLADYRAGRDQQATGD